MAETANYRIFLDLCDSIVQTSEKISDLRALPEIVDENEAEALKKITQSIQEETKKNRPHC